MTDTAPAGTDPTVDAILETVSAVLNRHAFDLVASYVTASRDKGRTPPMANIVEMASEAARPLAQLDAWVLSRGQSAYTGLVEGRPRPPGEPCAFVWASPGTGTLLTARQAAVKIQQASLELLEETVAAALADRGVDAATADAVRERLVEYRRHWCDPSFKRISGPDEPWIACDGCGVELTHMNCYIANQDEGLCVMCGESL